VPDHLPAQRARDTAGLCGTRRGVELRRRARLGIRRGRVLRPAGAEAGADDGPVRDDGRDRIVPARAPPLAGPRALLVVGARQRLLLALPAHAATPPPPAG